MVVVWGITVSDYYKVQLLHLQTLPFAQPDCSGGVWHEQEERAQLTERSNCHASQPCCHYGTPALGKLIAMRKYTDKEGGQRSRWCSCRVSDLRRASCIHCIAWRIEARIWC